MSEQSPFAARLRDLRTGAKMTQHELAEKAGMHRQTIAQLETGVRKPTWESVQALAKALGVDCTAFQTDDQPEAAAPPPPAKRKRKGK
jgi:transcriptional regulator with XRE-family HTH domain